jgi:hypothetical protein
VALRILASFLILISILFWPFWVSAILALLGIIYFRVFWEAIVLFFISDLLFGIGENRFWNITLVATIFIVILLLLVEFIKRKLKNYKE